MADSPEEVFIPMGATLPVNQGQGGLRRDTIWYQRLIKIIQGAPQGEWVGVWQGSKTHARAYRATFNADRMNVPYGHRFECGVITHSPVAEIAPHEGILVFRWLGVDPDAEWHDEITPFDGIEVIAPPAPPKPEPEPVGEPPPMWLKLQAEPFSVYCEFEATHGKSEEDVAAMVERWEDVNGPLPSGLTPDRERPNLHTVLGTHAGDPLDDILLPEVPDVETEADAALEEAREGLHLHLEDEVPVSGEPAPVLDEAPTGDNGLLVPAPQPGDAEEVRGGSEPEPEAAVLGAEESGDQVPLVDEPPSCHHDPYNKDHWWSPLQGAPPVCRFCAMEQPNMASVQNVAEHEDFAVVVQPDGRSIQEIIAAARADNGAPKAEAVIPGLEDLM